MASAWFGFPEGRAGYSGKRDWGLFFGGVALVIVGLVVVLWPGLTMVTLATAAGIVFLVAGVFDVITYVRIRKFTAHPGWVLVQALCNVLIGLMLLLHPLVTASVIPWLIGLFVAGYGIVAIVSAFRLRGFGLSWGLMMLNGVVALLCGLSFVISPETFVILLGIFLMMRGITMAVYGIVKS